MRKKQWIWLIAAVCVFAVTGVLSVAMNTWARRTTSELSGLSGLRGADTRYTSAAFPSEYFVAVVDIEGTIVSEGGAASLAAGGYDQEYLLDYVDRLMECDKNVGILLNINSGGGEMSASDELYLKLMDYKEATGNPIFAYFGNTACSGAYYIAMAADEIWANRNSICVNIGVYIETYNLSGLFDKYGVEEIMIRSSDNKGIGAVGQPWTDEQLAIYQSIVDLYYDQFLEVVSAGRGMTKEQVRQLDDGREMLAKQALEAGFVDGIGRYEEYTAQVLGYYTDEVVLYEEPAPVNAYLSLFDYLYTKLESLVPHSEAEVVRGLMDRDGGIVVMAYAG